MATARSGIIRANQTIVFVTTITTTLKNDDDDDDDDGDDDDDDDDGGEKDESVWNGQNTIQRTRSVRIAEALIGHLRTLLTVQSPPSLTPPH